jgi:hypothetical protein
MAPIVSTFAKNSKGKTPAPGLSVKTVLATFL